MSRTEQRAALRKKLLAIARVNTATQRLTSLGMHYIPGPGDSPILVLIEVNVPRLLVMLGQRCCKSKRGLASAARGSVRISLATAEAHEICGELRSQQ